MAWNDESERHKLAKMGIKTTPKPNELIKHGFGKIQPYELSFNNFKTYTQPIWDEKDWIKAWIDDNEYVLKKVSPGITRIPLINRDLLVYGNEKGIPIGILSFSYGRLHENENKVGVVDHLAVKPKYRNCGVASKLLEEVYNKYGVKSVVGNVSPSAGSIIYKWSKKCHNESGES